MDRGLLDHEVILRAALAQHAATLERAHKKLASTAMKVSMATSDSALSMRAMSVANTSAYHAAWSGAAARAELSAAKDRYNNNKRRREESDDECVSSSTKNE